MQPLTFCRLFLSAYIFDEAKMGFWGTFVLPRNAFALLLNKICIASTHTEKRSQHI